MDGDRDIYALDSCIHKGGDDVAGFGAVGRVARRGWGKDEEIFLSILLSFLNCSKWKFEGQLFYPSTFWLNDGQLTIIWTENIQRYFITYL